MSKLKKQLHQAIDEVFDEVIELDNTVDDGFNWIREWLTRLDEEIIALGEKVKMLDRKYSGEIELAGEIKQRAVPFYARSSK